jgi:hypothetical protein
MIRRVALFISLVVILGVYSVYTQYRQQGQVPPATTERQGQTDALLARALAERLSNLQVEGRGAVEKILPDDNSGSRHQRFILRLASGQTLLVAHNIDLAPRLEGLERGDEVGFAGEYEWNPQGGVLHWTHHDPEGRHPAGWLRHNGRTYR